MKYLFEVNIGPIQAFIAGARRTRDLKFSSWLLSEMAKAAAKKIMDIYGLNSLIFPAPSSEKYLDPGSDMNVANKIVASIDLKQGTLQELGDSIYQAVLSRLREIREKAYKKVNDDFDREVAERQTNALIEFFWVAVPLEDKNYNHNRQELEAVMAARKNSRDFDRVSWAGDQYKSSIDGQLESVISNAKYAQKKDTVAQKREKAKELYKMYGAGPAERLSGIDLLKRHGVTDTTSSFPSTSHMASLPFLVRLKALKGQELEEAKKLWSDYIKSLKKIAIDENLETVSQEYTIPTFLGNLEGSMLFEERFVDVVDMTDATEDVKRQIQVARRYLRSFYDYVDNQLGKARPYPYYAILSADGDHMGKTIDYLAEHEHGAEKHRELSQALDSFANNVNTIVEKHKGALVYAGGDDVLALLPLHTVIQCASKLSDSFKKALAAFSDGENSPTLSVGIAIVHHLDSLQESLSLARSTETKAKNIDDKKDALAITIRKRSGGETSVSGKWGDLNEHLERLISYFSANAIPDGTAYELQNLSLRLPSQGDDMLKAVMLQEAKRIIHRKLHGPQDTRTSGRAKEIEAYMLARLGISANVELTENTMPTSIEDFVNQLLVAQTLADVRKIAEYEEK